MVMDGNVTTVIVALITGIFSLVTLIIQKRQDKVIKKIDDQNIFIEKEKIIKDKMVKKEKEETEVIHRIMLLILDTNLAIIKANQINESENASVFKEAEELKNRFNKICEEKDRIYKEYQLLLEMSSELQEEMEKQRKK